MEFFTFSISILLAFSTEYIKAPKETKPTISDVYYKIYLIDIKNLFLNKIKIYNFLQFIKLI